MCSLTLGLYDVVERVREDLLRAEDDRVGHDLIETSLLAGHLLLITWCARIHQIRLMTLLEELPRVLYRLHVAVLVQILRWPVHHGLDQRLRLMQLIIVLRRLVVLHDLHGIFWISG